MGHHDLPQRPESNAHCCPCCGDSGSRVLDVTRRAFLGGVGAATVGSTALAGLSWSALASAGEPLSEEAPPRRALKVVPILVYSTPEHRHQVELAELGRHSDGESCQRRSRSNRQRVGEPEGEGRFSR